MKKAKFILLAMIALLTLEGCGGKTVRTDVEKDNLKGHVRYLSEHYFVVTIADDGSGYTTIPTSEGPQYIEKYYDKEGKVEKSRDVTYKYMNTDTYIYDKDLLVEIKHSYNSNKRPYSTTYFYNKDKSIHKVCNGKDERFYKYDDKGNILDDGEYEYKYDAYGNEIEKTSDAYSQKSIYDELGRVIEYTVEEIFEGESLRYHVTIEYDYDGNKTKEILKYGDGQYMSTQVNAYYYSDHDDEGNWRTQKICVNGELQQVVRRNIKYYSDDAKAENKSYLSSIIEDAYEKGISYLEFLKIPEVHSAIVNKYSRKYYDLALKYANDVILHKSHDGSFCQTSICEDHSSEEYGSGTKFSFNEERYDVPLVVELYLRGFQVGPDGELNVSPWKKSYYENDFGEIEENLPYYFIVKAWTKNRSLEENIEIRIDRLGIKFIKRNEWTNFSSNAEVKIKADGLDGVYVLPTSYHKGILYVTWNDEAAYDLIDLLSNHHTTISITEVDALGYNLRFTTDFYRMERTEVVVASLADL